jgi:hypothetical protein
VNSLADRVLTMDRGRAADSAEVVR